MTDKQHEIGRYIILAITGFILTLSLILLQLSIEHAIINQTNIP